MNVFYSYAHQDERLRKQLETHLSALKQEGLIVGWYDREIRAGVEWAKEIEAQLTSAHIILLLISPNFIASDYCSSIEMKRALEKHDAREARVIPIILRPCDWEGAPFGKLQVLPSNRKPVNRWPDRDEAFVHIAQEIRKAANELNAQLAERALTQQLATAPRDLVSDRQVESEDTPATRHTLPNNHVLPPITPQRSFLFNQPLAHPNEFFDRVRERDTLISRTYNSASTSIVGPRRIGKTWLLSYLKLVAPKELGTRFLMGYLDATTARCATVAGFMASMLEALSVQGHTPTTSEESLVHAEQAVQELLARNLTPVLCIDEFEGLSNREAFDLHFFTALRAMAQAGLSLVVTSKSPLIDIVGNEGKTSGFFNIFEQLILKPFSRKEAERFVQVKGAQCGLTEQERAYLLNYSHLQDAYWPLRLQLVGKMLLEDKHIAAREQDPDYYRPDDLNYWREFEQRVEEAYRGVVR